MKLHLMHDPNRPSAALLFNELSGAFENYPLEEADAVIALGGDGSVLYALQRAQGKPVFGLMPQDARSVGFWVNRLKNPAETLMHALERGKQFKLIPLEATIRYPDGTADSILAFNEVAVMKGSAQAIFIEIDGRRHVGTAVYASSAFGSTGLNRFNKGPVLHLNSHQTILRGIGACFRDAGGRNRFMRTRIAGPKETFTLKVPVSGGKRPVSVHYDGVTYTPREGENLDITIRRAPEKAGIVAFTRDFRLPRAAAEL